MKNFINEFVKASFFKLINGGPKINKPRAFIWHLRVLKRSLQSFSNHFVNFYAECKKIN